MYKEDNRILSRPLRVLWAGWETDTYRLQQAGWQLSAEQDVFDNTMRLAMRHEGQQIRGISSKVRFDYHMAHERHWEYLGSIGILMHMVGRDLMIHEHGKIDWNFQPIDATPTFTTNKISRIEDLCHFAAPLVRTKEIIIPEESVPELMDRILKLQQPARTARIREEMRESREGKIIDAIPQQKFEAQIISFPMAA